MDWTEVHAEHAELGRTWRVARPAFVVELYGEAPTMVPHGEAMLDRFLELVPEETELYYLGNNAREFKRMDARASRRIRKTLAELDKKGRSYMIKDAPEFDLNRYSIDLVLSSEAQPLNDRVCMALPVDFSSSEAVPFFASLVKEFPIWGAVAGFGFDLVWGREFEQTGMPVIFRTAKRFTALQVRDRIQEDNMIKKLKSAGWLTFLDEELVATAGGEDALRRAVEGDGVTVRNVRDGLLFQAGPEPPIGDVNRQNKDTLPLAAVNRGIEPVRIDRWFSTHLFGVERDEADEWLSRFD